jgi:hypothetical protein
LQKNRLFYYYAKHSISFLFVLIRHMKRIILLLITITTFTNVSYASFPVVEKVSFQTTKQIEPIIESISYNKSKFLSTKKSNLYFWNWKIFPKWSTYSFWKKALICLILLAASYGLFMLFLFTIGKLFVILLYNATMN